MVAPPKMKSKGRSSSVSSLSRKMSKFGSALGGGGSKKSSSSSNASASASVGKQKAAAASNDTTDATRKLQAAINRRAQRRGNKQKVTDLKKFSTSASSSDSNLSSNNSKGADDDKPQSKYLSSAPTLYADNSIDALTIPTASSSHSHDSQDTHQTSGSANSASSTDSLNALARENTPHKKKKKSARGVQVGSTPGRISTTFNANRVSGDGEEEIDGGEKDDCKDMFTPIVPRKKGRPPKRISDATDATAGAGTGTGSADGSIMNVAKVTLQQSTSDDASTAGSFATVNTGRSSTNHDRYEPAEQLLERAKARNDEMQRKQMEEERGKKERQGRYQALSQLLNAEESETTIKVDNTNVFHGVDANSPANAAPINTHGVVNRSKNGTPYVPKTVVPPPALSYSYSASSEVTYRSPTASEVSGDSNACAGMSSIDRTASQASSVTQPLYASQSLNVNGADDRVRYVRFTDVVTTFDDNEKKRNTAITHPVEKGDAGQPYESPFVKMHSVQHNYVGGEENRSEFEIELERKMMEHDIEVKRVGYHAQVSTTTASMQMSQNESAIQAQQRQQKAPSPNFANPLSPDGLLDGATGGAYTLHVDHREITYGHKKGPKRTITGKETKFVQDRAAGGATRSPTIIQTTEGFIELEAPEAAHTEYLLRKPTLSFGSQTAVSDVTASTIRHTNTGDYSSIDGDAEAKEYMYARATANTFKPPNSRANGGAMQQPQPSTSFFGGLADSMTQRLRDCVQPSYHQAVLQSPPPVKLAPPAGIGGRLRDCIAPRREFMVHSPHHGTNKGMMSI